MPILINKSIPLNFPVTKFVLHLDAANIVIKQKMDQFYEQVYLENWKKFNSENPKRIIDTKIQKFLNFNWWVEGYKQVEYKKKKFSYIYTKLNFVKAIVSFFLFMVSDVWFKNVHTKKYLIQKRRNEIFFLRPKKNLRYTRMEHLFFYINFLLRFVKTQKFTKNYFFSKLKKNRFSVAVFRLLYLSSKFANEILLQKFLFFIFTRQYIKSNLPLFLSFQQEINVFLKEINHNVLFNTNSVDYYHNFVINYSYFRMIDFIYSNDTYFFVQDSFSEVFIKASEENYLFSKEILSDNNTELIWNICLFFFDRITYNNLINKLFFKEHWEKVTALKNTLFKQQIIGYRKNLYSKKPSRILLFAKSLKFSLRNIKSCYFEYFRGRFKMYCKIFQNSIRR